MAVSLTTGERPLLPPFFFFPKPCPFKAVPLFSLFLPLALSLSFHVFLRSACEDSVTALPAACSERLKGSEHTAACNTNSSRVTYAAEQSLDGTVKTLLSLGCNVLMPSVLD